VEDPVAFEHEFAVADEGVLPALMAHDPRRLDFGAHAVSTRPSRQTLERISCEMEISASGELDLRRREGEAPGIA
jgi:hypothetical protein